MIKHGLTGALKSALAALCGTLAWLFGAWDALLYILLAMICLDYLTGLAAAALRQELSSRVGWQGLLKKALIFAVVLLAALVDRLLGLAGNAARSCAVLFYTANEGLSVMENLGRAGLPLPAFITRALTALKTRAEQEEPL